MDEVDPDQAEVMARIEPFLSRLYPILPAALDRYLSETTPLARAEHTDLAAAASVWSHAWAGLQMEFGVEPGFHFLEMRGLHVMNMRDELVIRLKKVDANGRHRNADTLQQRQFDRQMSLPGLPPAAARLVLGYQPDAGFSTVERVTLRRPRGAWVTQIVEVEEQVTWVDITPASLFSGVERRRAAG